MFFSLTGEVVHCAEAQVAIACGGVAFACSATANTLQACQLGHTTTLFTHLSVREDALELFGFATRAELQCFKQLIAVTGVGPKAALALLSAFSPEQLSYCIATGDSKSLTRAHGVGKKVAERLILELKDKVAPAMRVAPTTEPPHAAFVLPDSEALAALIQLGYHQSEALQALQGLDPALSSQEKIKQALRHLSSPLS